MFNLWKSAVCFNCVHSEYFSGNLFIVTTDATAHAHTHKPTNTQMHTQTRLGCCGHAWMQLFSVTALIISFNEHHSLLFPSAWFSLSMHLSVSAFLSLSQPPFLTHILSLSLFLSHARSNYPLSPKLLLFPLVWSSINAPFHICYTQTPHGLHPMTNTRPHTHTRAHAYACCVTFCLFKFISGISLWVLMYICVCVHANARM